MPEVKSKFKEERPENYNWEERYSQKEPLPWDSGIAAPELVKYFAGLETLPGEVFEIGCGTGTNAIWLAQQGCHVVGSDISPTASERDRHKAKDAGLSVRFEVADICHQDIVEAGSMDLVFDRGVFHVMTQPNRPIFAEKAAMVLKQGGHWLCLAGSKDEVREDPNMGPPQLSCLELLQHIEPLFYVEKIEKTYFVLPDDSRHVAWAALFCKR